MQSNSIFMWWLQQKQLEEQREAERPRLYVQAPYLVEERNKKEEQKEPARVIILDIWLLRKQEAHNVS